MERPKVPPPLPSRFRQGNLRQLLGEDALAIQASAIDKSSTEFRANAERMQALVEELKTRRAEAAAGAIAGLDKGVGCL